MLSYCFIVSIYFTLKTNLNNSLSQQGPNCWNLQMQHIANYLLHCYGTCKYKLIPPMRLNEANQLLFILSTTSLGLEKFEKNKTDRVH